MVNDLLPSYLEEETDASEGNGATDAVPNGHFRNSDAAKSPQALSNPFFPEVDSLLSLFKNSCTQLVDLRKQVKHQLISFRFYTFHLDHLPNFHVCSQIDQKLYNDKQEVSAQDSKHRKTLSEVILTGLIDIYSVMQIRLCRLKHLTLMHLAS